MKFTCDKASFGRHETFPLRYGWMTKGYHALLEDTHVFKSEHATVTLGVGKNMVNSIRYWLQAAQIVEKTSKGFRSTPAGDAVLGPEGYDPYLEDEATIWLIHWLLATNPGVATAWYWFFNRFHKPEFSAQELSSALLDFAKREVNAKFAATSVKSDANLVLRMYVRPRGNTRTPLEEALDSPLSMLGLVTQMPGTRTYQSVPAHREGLPTGVLGYSVSELFRERGVSSMPIEELMYGTPGWPAVGAIFRLTEGSLLTKLEQLVDARTGVFDIRETAGIHQLYRVGDASPLDYLDDHYKAEAREAVA